MIVVIHCIFVLIDIALLRQTKVLHSVLRLFINNVLHPVFLSNFFIDHKAS